MRLYSLEIPTYFFQGSNLNGVLWLISFMKGYNQLGKKLWVPKGQNQNIEQESNLRMIMFEVNDVPAAGYVMRILCLGLLCSMTDHLVDQIRTFPSKGEFSSSNFLCILEDSLEWLIVYFECFGLNVLVVMFDKTMLVWYRPYSGLIPLFIYLFLSSMTSSLCILFVNKNFSKTFFSNFRDRGIWIDFDQGH